MDYNYYDYNPNQNNMNGQKPSGKDKKPKKNHPWLKIVAMALVFGLIAGGTAFVTNYAARAAAGTATASTDGSSKSSSSGGSTKLKTSDNSDSTGSGSSSAGDQSVENVASEAMPSMVTISTMSVEEMQNYFGQSQQYTVSGAGTGVIVGENDDEYLIATNEHVVSGAQELSVGFIDESVASANIKGTDSENDLAVIAVNKSDVDSDTQSQISVITMGDSDNLALGQGVVAIGNALGYGQSVTSGYISALNRTMETEDGTTSEGLIQTDAAINPGNSGGALLNMDGELIGINEGKSSSANGTTVDNMGYAIPISKAEPILDDLMQQETKTVVDEDERGYLGISGADVTSEYAEVYNMPEGICIISTGSGSAAEQAGLKKGDVITKINGQSVSTLDQLKEQLQYYKAGESVEITAERADNGEYKEQTFTVTLESKSDLESQTGSQDSSSGSSSDGSGSSGNTDGEE